MVTPSVAVASNFFKALADPTRLELLYLVAEKKQCSHDLSQAVGITPATVTHHMKKLVDIDLVIRLREGKYTYFVVGRNFPTVDELVRTL